jgi:hypothetical protein
MPTFLLDHLSPRTADALASPSFALALAGTVLGLGLWATGARYSQGMITLLAVAVGGLVGGHLPGWRGWDVNPMGSVIVCAIAGGFVGYLLHTTAVGVVLALLVALASSAAVWAVRGQGAVWQTPAIPWASSPDLVADVLWKSLPEHLNRTVPIAFAIGLGAGGLLMLIRPKVGTALTYSLIATPLLFAFGLPLLQTVRPQWHETVPTNEFARWAIGAGLVALGTLVQWSLLPQKGSKKSASPNTQSQDQTNPAPRRINERAPMVKPAPRSPRVAEVAA